MVEDAEAEVVITEKKCAEVVKGVRARVLVWEEEKERIEADTLGAITRWSDRGQDNKVEERLLGLRRKRI